MKDYFGEYQILAGYEGSGKCWWCGDDFPDKRARRYCSEQCADNYRRHFYWAWAVPWALERAGYKCQECSKRGGLEVHHREPLSDEVRYCNIKNKPENLVVLCRQCHGKAHTTPKLTVYELAEIQGQSVMELVINDPLCQ